MNRKWNRKIFIMSSILLLATGCGTTEPGAESGAEVVGMEESADLAGQYGSGQGETDHREEAGGLGEADSRRETEGQESGAVTVAGVKTVVLENAGLSEDEVRFVRIHLDSENGNSEYDVEFVCQDAEYDYKVSALTGEILAMHCEMGNYDVDALPQDVVQAEGIPAPDASQAENPLPQDAPQADIAPEAGGQYIGSEAAKQIALDHAGLTAEEAHFVHAHLEQDDGNWKYDIEFHKDNTEYDYDIHALTGEILSFDQDAEYDQHGADTMVGEGQITKDRAKQIALAHAGVAEEDAQRLKIEFDYDDGRGEYEVEWQIGHTEYSCDVDASTGEILSYEKELD